MNCLNSSLAGGRAGAGAGPGARAGSGAGAEAGSRPAKVIPCGTVPHSECCLPESTSDPCGRFQRQSGAILNETGSNSKAKPEFACLPNGLAELLVELLEL